MIGYSWIEDFPEGFFEKTWSSLLKSFSEKWAFSEKLFQSIHKKSINQIRNYQFKKIHQENFQFSTKLMTKSSILSSPLTIQNPRLMAFFSRNKPEFKKARKLFYLWGKCSKKLSLWFFPFQEKCLLKLCKKMRKDVIKGKINSREGCGIYCEFRWLELLAIFKNSTISRTPHIQLTFLPKKNKKIKKLFSCG